MSLIIGGEICSEGGLRALHLVAVILFATRV